MSNHLNMNIGWMRDRWDEHVRYALRDGQYMDQDSVDFLRRLLEEIPEAIEQGKRNNRKSKLYRSVA